MVASYMRSARSLFVPVLLGLLVVTGQASADATKPEADLSFILTANQAIFSSSGLILNGTSLTAQYIGTGTLSDGLADLAWLPMLNDSIGLIDTIDFVSNSSHSMFMSSNGTWLDTPSAVLMTKDGNKTKAALLSLAAPSYDAVSRTMQFRKALLLPANTSCLTVSKGVTVKLAQQAASGAPTPLLDAVPMDAVWSGGVTMFIDHARGSLVPFARTEGLLLDLAAAAAVGVAAGAARHTETRTQRQEDQRREDQQRNTYNQNMAAYNDAGWSRTFPGWTPTGSYGK